MFFFFFFRESSGLQLHGYFIKGRFKALTDETHDSETRGEKFVKVTIP